MALDMSTVGYISSCIFAGVLGGLGTATVHATFEHAWFYFLNYLDKRGSIKRLAPSIPVTMTNYRKESFWAVAIGPMPMFAVAFIGRQGFMSRCHLSGDVLSSLVFTWTVMALHDAYFFAVHSLMHKFKSVYRKIHQWHHASSGDITVFSTAFGDILDIAFTFSPFYSLVLVYLYNQPTWNPLSLAFLGWAVHGVDLMGHCGYKLPVWIYGPGSLGVLLTPIAQRPKHHYIHHLDPRFNRSLYFTWCDRVAGTFREDHPKVVNDVSKILNAKEEDWMSATVAKMVNDKPMYN